MKMKKIDALLFQTLFLLAAGIIISRVAGLSSISSLFFTATFPVTVLLWLRSAEQGLDKTDWLMLATAALAVFCVVVELVANLFAGNAGVGFSYFKKVIMFIMTLLFFQSCHKFWAGRRMAVLIDRIADVVTVFMFVMYILFYDKMHMLNDIPTRYVTFRFSNPNMVAMFLVCLYMLKLCVALKPGPRKQRVFHFALAAILGYLVIDTRSRNAQMVTLLFTMAAFAVTYREWIAQKIHYKLPLRIGWIPAGVIASFPAVFAVVYMSLINSAWVEKVFGFMSSEGKKINSRVKVWKPAMEAIESSPLVGAYYRISEGTGVSQMHSTHVDIAASYGIPVLILVCILLVIYMHQGGRTHKNKTSFLYMVGFCCVLMLGVFEAAVFSGGLGIYVFAGMFLLLGSGYPAKRR